MSAEERTKLFDTALQGLPGSEERFIKEEILTALDTYKGIDAKKLKERLFHFLREVVPVA